MRPVASEERAPKPADEIRRLLARATGVDLDRLIEVGRMAEDIVGQQLPSELIHAGSLDAFRRKAA